MVPEHLLNVFKASDLISEGKRKKRKGMGKEHGGSHMSHFHDKGEE